MVVHKLNNMSKIRIIDKEVLNALFLKAIEMIDEPKQLIAEKIGKTTMIFSKAKNLESMPATETLGALRKIYGLNINALIDNEEHNLFVEKNTTELVSKIEELEKQVLEYKERAELLERLLRKFDK